MSDEQPTTQDAVDDYDDGPRGMAAIFGPTINAIFAPQAAFEAIASRPILAIWPVVWTTVGAVIMGLLNADVTRQAFRLGMIQSMQNQGQELDAEQLRPMLENMDAWAPVFSAVQNVFFVLFVVIVAALFWIGSSLSGGSTKFGKSFGVASVASVISPLLMLGFITLMWQVAPPEFRRIEEFQKATPTLSLALILANEDTSVAMTTLLQQFSLFNIWWVYVCAVGCRVLLGMKSAASWILPIGIITVMGAIGVFFATLGS